MTIEVGQVDAIDQLGITHPFERAYAQALLGKGVLSFVDVALVGAEIEGISVHSRVESGLDDYRLGRTMYPEIDLSFFTSYKGVATQMYRLRQRLAGDVEVDNVRGLGWVVGKNGDGRGLLLERQYEVIKAVFNGHYNLPWQYVGSGVGIIPFRLSLFGGDGNSEPLGCLVRDLDNDRVVLFNSGNQFKIVLAALRLGYVDVDLLQKQGFHEGTLERFNSHAVAEVNRAFGFPFMQTPMMDKDVGGYALLGNPLARAELMVSWLEQRGIRISVPDTMGAWEARERHPGLVSKVLGRWERSLEREMAWVEEVELMWIQLPAEWQDVDLPGRRKFLLVGRNNCWNSKGDEDPQVPVFFGEVTAAQVELLAKWPDSLTVTLPGSQRRYAQQFANLVQRLRRYGWEFEDATGTVVNLAPRRGKSGGYRLTFPVPRR